LARRDFRDVFDPLRAAFHDVARKAIDSAVDSALEEAEAKVTEVASSIARARKRVRNKIDPANIVVVEDKRRRRD
jgi:hypothetical protein